MLRMKAWTFRAKVLTVALNLDYRTSSRQVFTLPAFLSTGAENNAHCLHYVETPVCALLQSLYLTSYQLLT